MYSSWTSSNLSELAEIGPRSRVAGCVPARSPKWKRSWDSSWVIKQGVWVAQVGSDQGRQITCCHRGWRESGGHSLPASCLTPGVLPWRPFGLGHRQDDGRWGRRRGRRSWEDGRREGWDGPKGGVAGSGPGAGLCVDGKRPARRSSKEADAGGERWQHEDSSSLKRWKEQDPEHKWQD